MAHGSPITANGPWQLGQGLIYTIPEQGTMDHGGADLEFLKIEDFNHKEKVLENH